MYKSIKELFTAIADELRERLDIEGKIPTQDMPQRVQDLYFTAFNRGRETSEIYENITITQDCTNAYQLATIFDAVVNENEKIVMFINENWTSYPTADTPENSILAAMYYAPEYRTVNDLVNAGFLTRWRDGQMAGVYILGEAYDVNVKTGDVFKKVVLR